MNTSDPVSAFNLRVQTALITGGGTGLGLGVARCLAASGATVVLVGRRGSELEKTCKAIGERAHALPGDITRLESVPALAENDGKQGGPVTILVNNAGVLVKKPATETTDAEFASVMQTHVFGAFALTRQIGGRMVDRKSGCIVFTASMNALMDLQHVVPYSAAKSAYVGRVRSLATEWGPARREGQRGGARQQLAAPEGMFEAIPELEFDQTANLAAEAGRDQWSQSALAGAKPIAVLESD